MLISSKTKAKIINFIKTESGYRRYKNNKRPGTEKNARLRRKIFHPIESIKNNLMHNYYVNSVAWHWEGNKRVKTNFPVYKKILCKIFTKVYKKYK